MFVTKQINTLKNIILMKTKPFLSFWQIWNLTFGFLGIQFGFALQNANSSRILQTYGADVEQLSLFWLAAPLTGMIIQPIIGHYSDQTWCRLGRRRPFFLVGAIFTTIALILMPNAGLFLSPGTETAISRIDLCGYVDDHGCFHQCNDGAFPCLGRGYATR